ncbi:MAG: hypothetical protein ACXWDO_05895, partial [Bacteroidia bacterium]
MKKYFLLILFTLVLEAFFTQPIYGQAQQVAYINKIEIPKVVTNSYGIALGASQGNFTTIEAGFEKYWGRIRLSKPRTTAVSLMASINPFNDIGGITSHVWTRNSRFGLTYGVAGGYYSDFDSMSKVAVGPALGYRMLGIHLVLGYNLLLGDKAMQ